MRQISTLQSFTRQEEISLLALLASRNENYRRFWELKWRRSKELQCIHDILQSQLSSLKHIKFWQHMSLALRNPQRLKLWIRIWFKTDQTTETLRNRDKKRQNWKTQHEKTQTLNPNLIQKTLAITQRGKRRLTSLAFVPFGVERWCDGSKNTLGVGLRSRTHCSDELWEMSFWGTERSYQELLPSKHSRRRRRRWMRSRSC